VLGVFIFGCTVTFGFTGYLLPWNQLSYWATTVGTEITGAIPWPDQYLKVLLRGGEGVTGETLARFYVLHVVVLPWVLTMLIATHLVPDAGAGPGHVGARGRGNSHRPSNGIPFFPNHVLKEAWYSAC
jgi:quinol-cytochrome oxidoreductase complex cytochrome b subunit